MPKRTGGLIRPNDPEQIQDLIWTELQAAQRRIGMHDEMVSLQENTYPISFPPKVQNAENVYSGLASQQLGLMRGILDEQPTVKVAVTSVAVKAKAVAEEIQQFDNRVFQVLEAQGGAVFHDVREDVLRFGVGVDCLDLYPGRLADGPQRGDYTEPGGYLAARKQHLRNKGTPSGRLPWVWRRIDPRFFLWREDPETDGLSLAIEIRWRNLKELIESPRYRKRLPKLRSFYQELADKDKTLALTARVRFVIVQDPYWTTYFAMHDLQPKTLPPYSFDSPYGSTAASTVLGSFVGGEIAEQFPNDLGKIQYVLTRGLTSGTEDPARRYRGIYYDMRHLIRAYDAFLSWITTRRKDFLFAPAVITQTLLDPNGVPYAAAEDDGGTPADVNLEPGAYTLQRLQPGEAIQFVEPPIGQDEQYLLETLKNQALALGVPDDLVSPKGIRSGFLFESLLNVTLARHRPIITGISQGHRQRVELLHEQIKLLGEPLSVLAQENKSSGTEATWYSLDPDSLEGISVEAVYDVKRPQDQAQALSNYAQSVQTGALDEDNARSLYLSRQDHEVIRQNKLLDELRNMPQVKQFLLLKVLEQSGMLVDQQRAAAQANVSPDQLLNATPSLAATYASAVQPGEPGYSAAQAALPALLAQQANGAAPTAPGATPSPPGAQPPSTGPSPVLGSGRPPIVPGGRRIGPTVPRPGGRPAGLNRRPGGPRRSVKV